MKRMRFAPWISLPPSTIFGPESLTELKVEWPTLSGTEYYDPLTGVYNRRAYDQLIDWGLKEAVRQNAGIGLLIFDIDYFKKVNDTFGHNAGDAVLQEFTRRMAASLREKEILNRLGGEEFTVLTPCYPKVLELGERVRLAVGQAPFLYEEWKIPITCSFGCAIYPVDGYDPTDLFRQADEALYQAKRNGRNQGVQCKKGGIQTCDA
ncbi:GGDEF domain-containing protein [Desulforamulus ruminis]|uniref:GGDEF domain-containing protein n=1 Tax=Desulforamulus ruminis TaxID=1564 RepID=UPI002FDAF42F